MKKMINQGFKNWTCMNVQGGPVIWAWKYHIGGLKFKTPCKRKQGVCLLDRAHRTKLGLQATA